MANVYYTSINYDHPWLVTSYPEYSTSPFEWSHADISSFGVDMFFRENIDLSVSGFYCVSAILGEYYAVETNQAISVVEQQYLQPGDRVIDYFIDHNMHIPPGYTTGPHCSIGHGIYCLAAHINFINSTPY